MSWRFIELRDWDPHRFQPLPEAVSTSVGEGFPPNTLLFTQLAGEYVGIGKNASIKQVVDLDFCKANRIPVIRTVSPHRTSGFVDSNTIRTLLVVKKDTPPFSDMDKAEQLFYEAAVASLKSLGLKAEHIPKTNNVVVKGKKVSICNLYVRGNIILFRWSIALDFNYDRAEKAIYSSKDMREWVTTVKKELGREVSVDELKGAIKQGFQQTLGIEFEEGELSSEELNKIEGLLPKYTSETWLKYGKWSPVKDYWRPE